MVSKKPGFTGFFAFRLSVGNFVIAALATVAATPLSLPASNGMSPKL